MLACPQGNLELPQTATVVKAGGAFFSTVVGSGWRNFCGATSEPCNSCADRCPQPFGGDGALFAIDGDNFINEHSFVKPLRDGSYDDLRRCLVFGRAEDAAGARRGFSS